MYNPGLSQYSIFSRNGAKNQKSITLVPMDTMELTWGSTYAKLRMVRTPCPPKNAAANVA